MPTDPVCGMYVPDTVDLFLDREGQRYYFCSKDCQRKFASPEEEARKLRNRLIVGWILSIPVIIITYSIYPSTFPQVDYLLLALSIPVQFYSALGFYEGSYHAIKSRAANMDLLVALGTVTAFLFSAFVTFFPSLIPGSAVFFDSSTFIVTLILTGNYVENITKARANRAANKLISMVPDVTHFISQSGEVIDKKTGEISPGDRILLKPGEIASVDGTVYEGKSEVDESMLTGEQEPVLKYSGLEISSGTKNLNGVLKVTVSRTGKNSTISQIYDLIQKAISGRAKVQRIADVFSRIFVPIVIAVALSASLFWGLYLNSVGYGLALEIAILAFVSVVVIACPCAIGLAGPITLLISSTLASENGIIVKNASALDRLSKATRAVFDKTGTLTEPDPVVEEIIPAVGQGIEDVVRMAASIETASNHPIARAIVQRAKDSGISLLDASDLKEMPGVGITGRITGKEVQVSRAKKEGGSAVSVRVDGKEAGTISLSYKIRDDAFSAIDNLRTLGIKASIVTGDSFEEGKRIGNKLGIDDIHAEILPEQKSEIIKEYQKAGDYVIFTGDGINDSIALETADTGIAMGSGTDVARESGDIILLTNNLNHVAYAKVIGDKTIGKIKQNIGWAFGYNVALIPIAAGVLVPYFGLTMYTFLPILSAFAMGMSSTSVVVNSLRLRRKIHRSLKRLRQS